MNFIDEITLEELHDDPYPLYARLRREAPIAHVPVLDEWVITRWSDCSDIGHLGESELIPNQAADREFFGMPNILCMDGEPHRKLRIGIDDQLNPRAVNAYIGNTAMTTIRRYIDEVRDCEQLDLVHDLFDRISVRVVGDKLGLTDIDDETLVTWFKSLSNGLTNRVGDTAEATAAQKSIEDIDEELRKKIDYWRTNPDDSIISHMLHGGLEPGEEPRHFDDVIGSIRVIILGGFQEPGNSVATAFLGLLQDPEQYALAATDPEQHARAIVHESLRWVAPIGMVTRQTRRDTTISGVVIPAGQHVTLAVASANRDESIFVEGEKFDFRRERLPIATFGYSNHHCSGHFLAKALGQAVVREVLSVFPKMSLSTTEEPVVSGMLFRGTKKLPVTLNS